MGRLISMKHSRVKEAFIMRAIQMTDETLCLKTELNFKEKLEIAAALDQMGVGFIELPAPKNVQDTLLLKALSATLKSAALSVRTPLATDGVDETWAAVRDAARSRLTVFVPLSPMQLEYQCHKKPKAVPEMVKALVSRCREMGADTAFVAGDATRAEQSLLSDAVKTAIAAGAQTIIFSDDLGQALPEEFAAFISGLFEKLPELKQVSVGVSCQNDLNLALPCVLSALTAGAGQVVTGTGASAHPSPEALYRVLDKKGAVLGMETSLNAGRLTMLSRRIEAIQSTPKSATSPFETGVRAAQGEGLLSASSDMNAVLKAVAALGYDLMDDDRQKVYDAFQTVAEKKSVTFAELDAIVASVAMQVPAAYRLDSYVINNGNIITATAHIRLSRDGQALEGISLGDGPIDAAFLAIEKIIGHHFELDDFKIQSVTEGREAMGDALVRLRANGKLYAGRGTSTDIVGASIRAYVNALNKIVWDEVNA